MDPRVKRLPVRIVLASVATLLSLVVGELAVRLSGAAPGFAAIPFGLYVTSADPELLWEPRPGAEGVNSAGLRGADAAEPRTRPRLLVLGDSIAWGLELADDATIPARLEARLAERGYAVEVLNAGVSGYGTVQEARRLEVLAPRLEPEHVLLLVCVNDFDPPDLLPEGIVRYAHRNAADGALQRVHGAVKSPAVHRLLMSRSHLYRLLHGALAQRRGGGAGGEEPAREPTLAGVLAGLDRIAAVAAQRGIDVTVAVLPFLDGPETNAPHLVRYEAVLAAARARGFDTVDLVPVLLGELERGSGPLALPDDRIHPNAAGADLIARTIAERWLQRATRAGSL
jgi:lysophospholipase L1-like esterase